MTELYAFLWAFLMIGGIGGLVWAVQVYKSTGCMKACRQGRDCNCGGTNEHKDN